MSARYGEASVMFGYALGGAVTPMFAEWAHESGRTSLAEVLDVCSQLFVMALLFGLVRLLFRGLRWAGRLPARRRRMVASASTLPSQGRS